MTSNKKTTDPLEQRLAVLLGLADKMAAQAMRGHVLALTVREYAVARRDYEAATRMPRSAHTHHSVVSIPLAEFDCDECGECDEDPVVFHLCNYCDETWRRNDPAEQHQPWCPAAEILRLRAFIGAVK